MTTTSLDTFLDQQRRLNSRRRPILHPLMRLLMIPLTEWYAEGVENVPESGATMLLGNHISILDPLWITAANRNRFVISMAKSEMLDNTFQSIILRTWGNFVVNRDVVDREALKRAIGLLEDEQLLWIAAEGTRNPDGMQEPTNGAAYIAYKTDAVVVPTVMCGAQDWKQRWKRWNRAYAKVVFGKPFRFHLPEGERLSRDVRDKMVQEAMYQIALTTPEDFAFQRGIYSDLSKVTTDYIQFV
ncbi:MAG: lysophospholipid acyltransferase family protein [Chloroflexota bacterium]